MVVYSGADHRVLLDVAGTTARAQFGYEVDGAGDLDADGVIDFLVGAPFSSGGGVSTRGRVVAVSGVDGHTLWERDGDGAIALFGSGLASLGVDRNGDGAAEVVVGAFGAGPLGTGLAYELSGRDGVVRRVLVPDASAGSFGWFFAHPAGDVDGDDAVDILVSDFSDGAAGALSGRAYVFSGARSVAVQPTGAEPGNAPLLSAARVSVIAARSVGEGFGPGRGAGDLDGDGRADLILAGYTNSTGGAVAGAVHLVRGIDGTTLRTITGAVAGASLGFDALIVGDLDRDGHRDILITGVGVAYVVAGR
jgi:hypothetical protein